MLPLLGVVLLLVIGGRSGLWLPRLPAQFLVVRVLRLVVVLQKVVVTLRLSLSTPVETIGTSSDLLLIVLWLLLLLLWIGVTRVVVLGCCSLIWWLLFLLLILRAIVLEGEKVKVTICVCRRLLLLVRVRGVEIALVSNVRGEVRAQV